MLIEFEATQLPVLVEGKSLSVAVGAPPNYLLFSRTFEPKQDVGVYLEYKDQLYSGYECIASCAVSIYRLEIMLSKPIKGLKGIEGFRVKLSVPRAEYKTFARNMQSVFRGKEEILHV